MARLTKLVVAAPEGFYSRTDKYVCTGCAKSFHFPAGTPAEKIDSVYREHDCTVLKSLEQKASKV